MNRNIGSTDSVDTNQKQQRRPLAVPRAPYPGRSARRSGVSQKDKIESKFSFDTADAVRDKPFRIRSYEKQPEVWLALPSHKRRHAVTTHFPLPLGCYPMCLQSVADSLASAALPGAVTGLELGRKKV